MDIAVQYCASFGCGDSSEWIESEMELITPQEEEGYRKMRCLNLELGEVA